MVLIPLSSPVRHHVSAQLANWRAVFSSPVRPPLKGGDYWRTALASGVAPACMRYEETMNKAKRAAAPAVRSEGGVKVEAKAGRGGKGLQPGNGLLPSPRLCMRTRNVGGRKCDKCGRVATILHVPLQVAGVFDAGCCPVCNPQSKPEGAS
jgi:hypothetical protein